jgi:intracellular sulfur oxidation DsrE/DsrF family protein
MDESDALPPALLAVGLRKQLASGVVVLACNIALQSWIDAIRQRNRVSDAEARNEAVGALVPGVVLQPSGVLAAFLAQEHGCAYIHAS